MNCNNKSAPAPKLVAPINQAQAVKVQREAKTLAVLARLSNAPDDLRIDVHVTAALCGSGATTIWTKSKNGQFPPPKRFGRSTRWRLGDIRKYLAGGEK